MDPRQIDAAFQHLRMTVEERSELVAHAAKMRAQLCGLGLVDEAEASVLLRGVALEDAHAIAMKLGDLRNEVIARRRAGKAG